MAHTHDHHDHGHDRHGHHHSHGHSHAPADFGFAFGIGITLNILFVIVGVAFGVIGHSMALIADAGHNLSDVLGLVMAWAAFALADNFVMRPGDVVWVGPSGVTEWNRVLSQLLPISSVIGTAALANQRGL